MEIIEEEVKDFWLVYDDEDITGEWYEFPCDEMGNILWDKCPYPDTAKKNLAYCEARQGWAKHGKVEMSVTHNRYGVCPCCGRRVCLGGNGFAPYMGLVECECGQWYNVFGQALKPPEHWYDDRDDDLYNDWIDDSYKYRYEE